MVYYNHTTCTSTLETKSLHMTISLKYELVFIKLQLTLLEIAMVRSDRD